MVSIQSTTAAISQSSNWTNSSGFNDLSQYDIPLTSPPQASANFDQLLRDLRITSVDPRSVRKAACCAALIETVQERRQNQQEQQQQVSPNELFLATLAALTSLQETLEQKVQSTDNIDTISGRDHGGRNLKGDNLIGKAMRIQSGQQKGYLDCLIEFLRPFHCRQVFP